jgi:hypothetical protein
MLTATAVTADAEFDQLIDRIADAVRKKLAPEGKAPVDAAKSDANANEQTHSSTDDLRTERRRRVLMSGKITCGERHSSVDCSIRNLSPTGACIRLNGLQALPKFFKLYVEREGLVRDAELVWTKNLSAGVAFTGWEKKIANTNFKDRNSVLELVKSMGIAS